MKKNKKLKKKNKSNIGSYIFWAIMLLIVFLGIDSIKISRQIIKLSIDNSMWMKISLIAFLIIAPTFVYFYLRKMKEEFFLNGVIAIIASSFLSFFIGQLYDTKQDKINIYLSRNNEIKEDKCKIISASILNSPGTVVKFIFKGDTTGYPLNSRGHYLKLKNHLDDYHINLRYKDGLNNSYIIETIDVIENQIK